MSVFDHFPGVLRAALGAAFAAAVVSTPAAFVLSVSTNGATATSISVLVNDTPITEYDIAQRQKLITATSGGNAGPNPRQRAVDELIEEALKLQEARRMGISVAAAEVDQAFATIAERVKMSPAQFSQALQQIGVNPATLKKRLESDLTWRDVVLSRFRTSVRIRDRDIEAALQRKGEELPTTTEEFAIQQILLIIPSGSSADYARQRKHDAEAFRAKYTGCDSARDLAKSFRDIVVKDTIRRNAADVGAATAARLKDIPVGGISTPTESPQAIELIGICDRKEIQDDSAARSQVKSELMNEQGERLSRRLLIDLKQSAVIEYR